MTLLPDFKLEAHFSKWEFKAKYHMTASDAESWSIKELLSLVSEQEQDAFHELWLGYTETYGSPSLRNTIGELYQQCNAEEILCFAGASEGIFAANQVLLDDKSHAIVITPNYQSHETLPVNIGTATGVALDADNDWSLDLNKIEDAVQPNTKLLTINFPHNPTGTIPPLSDYLELVTICRKHGIYILHDEIFNGLGPSGTTHLPYMADVYERGLSLNVMSKAYGLPGLRIGWIACQDKTVLSKMERLKHYLSICNSAPSEYLAELALKYRQQLLNRNCTIIDENLPKWEAFFADYPNHFEWKRPDGSCMAYPKYTGTDGVETFCRRLVEESGVLFLPSTIYQSELGPTPQDRFRLGFGRRGLDEGITALRAFMESQ